MCGTSNHSYNVKTSSMETDLNWPENRHSCRNFAKTNLKALLKDVSRSWGKNRILMKKTSTECNRDKITPHPRNSITKDGHLILNGSIYACRTKDKWAP